ncbi:MAG: lysophospholipid acyltransferase family protein [Flavobacteriales bacterium]|nr:lysophospholipid acyltransferase family protein [Flavobacteriales bacterium]
MKRLVEPAELAKASHMRPGDSRIAVFSEVSGINKLQRLYEVMEPAHGAEFISDLFRHLDLRIEVSDEDLALVPRTGGVVFVANHPYGAIDGMALIQVLDPVRPDLQVMANFMLKQFEPLKDRFIGVNPFEELKSRSSFQGMRQAMEHVGKGGALGIFPAGEVSSWQTDLKAVADQRWKPPVVKLIRNARVPVVPIWFDGSNSRLFHALGMIHPTLRTIVLPGEMMRMRGRHVRMRIGKPILPNELDELPNIESLGRYLRAKTYSLGSGVQVKREQFRPLFFPRRAKEITAPEPIDRLLGELDGIADLKLSSQAEFDLYLAPAERMPHLLREIGRKRELTFRAVGEGTNKRIDLDEFDLYYDHLFLWDREKRDLAGAYRVGDGARIMPHYGKRGLYTSTLFRMGRPMDKVLAQSFELGRSFVTQEYQKHRLPLFLLWRGLLIHILSHPGHRYLIGPVSISSNYSRFSRALIMAYVRQHHYDHGLAAHVEPRNRFKVAQERADSEVLVEHGAADLKKLDKLIADIEPNESSMPVLLKKYLLLNARIIGFNSDPRFNDALDGLMLLDLTKVPAKTLEDLKKGMAEAGDKKSGK